MKHEFYLVSYRTGMPRTPRVSWWMKDAGGSWDHFIKGVLHPKNDDDQVVTAVKAACSTELDWTRTPLHDRGRVSGWLSRDGRFYGCPSNYHDKFAFHVLGAKVPELEQEGWVRIYFRNYYTCEKRLSAEQANWLSQNGHKIYDLY